MFFTVGDIRRVGNALYEVSKYWGTNDDVKFREPEIMGVTRSKNDV